MLPIVSSIDAIAAAYDNGVMPVAGGYLEQPARLMQAIRLHKRGVYLSTEMLDKRKNFKGNHGSE